MSEPYRMSKPIIILLVIAVILNLLFLTGTVTGVVPDIARMGINAALVVAIILDWRRHKREQG